jgi:gliding motility-associated-like protein
MKALLVCILSLLLNFAQGQVIPPSLQWQRCFGGSLEDDGSDIQSTPDGGFIITGSSASSDGDINQNKGQSDAWIIKFNAAGNIEWQKIYGGTYSENLVAIKVLAGGGYIVTGYTTSNDGDVSGLHGGTDIWVIRLDNVGNIIWQKCYGGSLNEFPETIFQTSSGGFILFGHSTSMDGDVSGVHVGLGNLGDVWVVNLDGSGNILWQHCYGGSSGESAGEMEQTPDGGFIFTSYTSSANGDVSGNVNGDFWLVRINASGNILWQKSLGGNAAETPFGLVQVADGYVIAGISFSDERLNNNHGNGDVYVIKTDLNGNIVWQKFYGGTEMEAAYSIIRASDGGYFLAGISKSADGETCKNIGQEDYFILKLNAAGNLEWQKSYGGINRDKAFGIIETADGSLYVTGSSFSNDNDVTANHGAGDMWLTKLAFTGMSVNAEVSITSSTNTSCPGKNIQFTAVPINGGANPSYKWYINNIEQPSAIGAVFNSTIIRDGDSIFCKLTSNLICIDKAEAKSNSIKITIDTIGAPSDFLLAESTICEGFPLEINSLRAFPTYLWSTGATSPSISVINSGIYWLEVPYNTSCISRAYTKVLPKNCKQSFYFPTGFTPNSDGKNDFLKPIIYGLTLQYKLTIYNRWGQVIFNSTNPDNGWNGKWMSQLQDSNIFIWSCTYQLAGEAVKIEKGTFMLIR